MREPRPTKLAALRPLFMQTLALDAAGKVPRGI